MLKMTMRTTTNEVGSGTSLFVSRGMTLVAEVIGVHIFLKEMRSRDGCSIFSCPHDPPSQYSLSGDYKAYLLFSRLSAQI